MTPVAASVPGHPSRVRIAISSPDILAQIRQAFAGRNLDVEIVSLPYVELTVRPAAGPPASDRPPVIPAPRRLCAEYRLSVVAVGDAPRTARAVPAGRPHPPELPQAGVGGGADADRGTAADGREVGLSQRQHEVMALVSRGLRNAEIADRLQVSEKTVKNHTNRIFRLLGAGSRIEAVLIWQRQQPDAIRRAAPRSGPGPGPAVPARPAGSGGSP